MRILFASEGIDEAGGVDTYVTAVMAGLASRGHQVSYLHFNRRPAGARGEPSGVDARFGVEEEGIEAAFERVRAWGPDVCYSHNMQPLAVDRRLLAAWPVVKMMHGYFGTCIGGQKSFAFPARTPCARRFGPACLALYLPRRCGQVRPSKMIEQYAWARQQRALLPAYAAIVVASDHMREEYLRHGVDATCVHMLPLFPSPEPGAAPTAAPSGTPADVVFLGRMTALKGGDLLITASATASSRLGRDLSLVMAGDGPRRAEWEALARRIGVRAAFVGWIGAKARHEVFGRARVLAVPSVWPEPFGLVGLEAAAAGVPAVAFDVGGIRQWLCDGENGCLAPAPPSASSLAGALVRALEDPARLSAMRAAALAVAGRLSLDRHLDGLEPVLGAAAVADRSARPPA